MHECSCIFSYRNKYISQCQFFPISCSPNAEHWHYLMKRLRLSSDLILISVLSDPITGGQLHQFMFATCKPKMTTRPGVMFCLLPTVKKILVCGLEKASLVPDVCPRYLFASVLRLIRLHWGGSQNLPAIAAKDRSTTINTPDTVRTMGQSIVKMLFKVL